MSTAEAALLEIRALALALPDTGEGVACAGTALEKRTITTRNKAFLFLGTADLMVKLRESLPQATALAESQPGIITVGAHGWVTVRVGERGALPPETPAWVRESHALVRRR
jgi:hypothetical protein